MKALVIGATGATGKQLVNLLLEDDEIHQLDIFVRRDLPLQHPKLTIHRIDFDQPEQWKSLVTGNVLFSCLGTTLKTAGSKAAQWKIDYEYQYQFARTASENKVPNFVLVSASNASAGSLLFYSRMKGQLEEEVKKLSFEKILIFKPPLLIRENTDRPMEIQGEKVIRFFNSLGMLRSQTPLHVSRLAQAMITAVKTFGNGIWSIQGQAIVNIENALKR